MKRNRILMAAVAAITSIGLLAGCSSALGGGDAATVNADSSVTIGLVGGVTTLDPHNTRSVASDLSVLSSIYSSLVTRSADGTITPNLATTWESSQDDLVWTFKLNPDAVFSDGTAVDAETVKWNFERAKSAETPLRWAGQLTNVSTVDASDPTTVVITLAKPSSEILNIIQGFLILSPDWVAANDPTTAAMGSGPYLLTDYTPAGAITLTANPDYWGELAAITTVEYSDLGSVEAEINALRAGEVDLVGGISPREAEQLTGVDGVSVTTIARTSMSFVKFNTNKAPVDNALVRQALNYAVDKKSILDSLLLGTVDEAQGQILGESYAGYDDSIEPYPYDPEKAKSLLAEAGYADGFTLEMDVPTDTYIEGENIAQAISAQLAEVGVTVTISTMPFATYIDKYVGQKNMAQSIYISQAGDTTGDLLANFRDGSVYAYWSDQTFAKLLDEARYTPSNASEPERYHDALEYFREQAPVLFLFPQPGTYGMSSKLNWTARADGYLLPYDMGLSS